jgi:uncharacterized OB-fold protein
MDPNAKLPETLEGTVVFSVEPLVIKDHYEIDYLHSYAQDSPFFRGLSEGKLLGSRCDDCSYTYATPRAACMYCGKPTRWVELPLQGRVHSYTTCFFGSEAFLKETPYHLILVEFDGVDTLFLSRLVGVESDEEIYIGMPVRARFRRNAKFRATDIYFVPTPEAVRVA